MIKIVLSFVLLVGALYESHARVAPAYIKTCPGLKDDCLMSVVQEMLPLFAKGIPELGVESIDPLREDRADIDLPGGFKIEFRNGTMTGLRKCTVDSVSYKNHEADFKLRCDLIIKGKYKAHGRILIVTINGDGDAKIKIKNDSIHLKIRFEDRVRDGVTYYEVKDFDFNQNYGDKVTFGLTNLFKGNPEISEAVLQFLNQNWKQIAEEFGKPLVDRLVDIIFKIVHKFFEKVPKDELFIEE